jgi:DNA-binding CsgD family transcriptional regulator
MFARLRRAAVGEPALHGRIARLQSRLLELAPPGPAGVEAPALSSREIDVLAHTGLGLRNGETAELLGLSAETVKSYLRSAMTKLDAHSRQEAVRRSRELGVLP